MDRKARYSVLFGPFIRGGTGCGRPTGLISPTGHAQRQLGRVDLEGRPSATRVWSHSASFSSSPPAVTAKWARASVIMTESLDVELLHISFTRPAYGLHTENVFWIRRGEQRHPKRALTAKG
jgi:hypothetical protein